MRHAFYVSRCCLQQKRNSDFLRPFDVSSFEERAHNPTSGDIFFFNIALLFGISTRYGGCVTRSFYSRRGRFFSLAKYNIVLLVVLHRYLVLLGFQGQQELQLSVDAPG